MLLNMKSPLATLTRKGFCSPKSSVKKFATLDTITVPGCSCARKSQIVGMKFIHLKTCEENKPVAVKTKNDGEDLSLEYKDTASACYMKPLSSTFEQLQ